LGFFLSSNFFKCEFGKKLNLVFFEIHINVGRIGKGSGTNLVHIRKNTLTRSSDWCFRKVNSFTVTP